MKREIMMMLGALLLLSACGVREQLEEQAAEAIAEAIVEQATGAEDVEFDVNGESISYSVEGEDGESIEVNLNAESDVDAIIGMGFDIPLPTGLVEGQIQRIGTDGAETMVVGQFVVQDLTAVQFYEAIHASLAAQGFVYDDPNGEGATQPDTDNPLSLLGATYHHPDGYAFTILWAEEAVILGLSTAE